MRSVPTAKQNGDVMQSKSRIIFLGHLDPLIGTYRTDAPTTYCVKVQVAVALAVSLDMSGETLDVSAAFLSGMPIERSIHVRVLSNGLQRC